MQQTVRVAAVQAEPAWLDLAAGVDKVISLIGEAAAGGARLVAFPETFVPGYPWWIWLDSPAAGMRFVPRYLTSSMTRDGADIDRIRQAAARHDIHVVLGFSERSGGSLYMAQAFISGTGELISVRRKLKPTHVERSVFGECDGSDLQGHDTAQPAERGVVDLQVAAVTLAEHRPLHVRGLELAAHGDQFARAGDERLGHVEAATGPLAEPEHHVDVVPGRGLADPVDFGAVAGHRAGEVPRDEPHARGRGVEPDPPRVAGNEGLGERHQPGSAGRSLPDERDHLVHARGQVQPGGLGLNSGNAYGLLHRWPPALSRLLAHTVRIETRSGLDGRATVPYRECQALRYSPGVMPVAVRNARWKPDSLSNPHANPTDATGRPGSCSSMTWARSIRIRRNRAATPSSPNMRYKVRRDAWHAFATVAASRCGSARLRRRKSRTRSRASASAASGPGSTRPANEAAAASSPTA